MGINVVGMDFELKKREIQEEIGRIKDEKLLWAIARLLHLDDEGDIPDWHKNLLEERLEKYSKNKEGLKDWNDVKNNL